MDLLKETFNIGFDSQQQFKRKSIEVLVGAVMAENFFDELMEKRHVGANNCSLYQTYGFR